MSKIVRAVSKAAETEKRRVQILHKGLTEQIDLNFELFFALSSLQF